jgi:hypothetical protein
VEVSTSQENADALFRWVSRHALSSGSPPLNRWADRTQGAPAGTTQHSVACAALWFLTDHDDAVSLTIT